MKFSTVFLENTVERTRISC